MAEEPQSPNASLNPNTASAETDDDPPALPANPEARAAAAALSSLDAPNDEDSDPSKSKARSDVDQEALGKAMSRLDVGGGGEKAKGEAEGETKRKAVKVDQADVALLVDQLDLSKVKATELLKAHEGDAVKAMMAWVVAAV